MRWIPAILLLGLYLSACVQPAQVQKTQVECPNEEDTQESAYIPSDFDAEIPEIEPQAQGSGRDAEQANLVLSFLYSHHENPNPDYQKAQLSLERYIELSGIHPPPMQVQNRLDLLRKMNEILSAGSKHTELIELMRKDNRTLMLEVQQLKNDVQTLQNENLAMKQMMERLNQLEMQHEQKRKQLK